MKIELGNDLVLTTDTHQYILNKRRTRKTDSKEGKAGETYLTGEGYFVSFESFLKHYAHKRMVAQGCKDLEAVAKALAKLTHEIKGIGDMFRAAYAVYDPTKESIIGIED